MKGGGGNNDTNTTTPQHMQNLKTREPSAHQWADFWLDTTGGMAQERTWCKRQDITLEQEQGKRVTLSPFGINQLQELVQPFLFHFIAP